MIEQTRVSVRGCRSELLVRLFGCLLARPLILLKLDALLLILLFELLGLLSISLLGLRCRLRSIALLDSSGNGRTNTCYGSYRANDANLLPAFA